MPGTCRIPHSHLPIPTARALELQADLVLRNTCGHFIMEATHFSMANSTTTQKLCNWFIQQANAKGLVLTPVKLNHLVILADWWHLHRTGGFLINERVEAWPSGPVLPSIYHEYKDQPPYSSIEHPSRRQPPLEEETDIIPFLEHIWNV